MRLRHALNAAALACAAIASTTAHAELQTWHLTAQVYMLSSDATPQQGFAMGQTIGVDYTFDTEATEYPNWPGLFNEAVTSFTINGQTSVTGFSRYLLASGSGLNAINVQPDAVRADGIDFVSFNLIGGTLQASVPAALSQFALLQGPPNLWTDLRVDFGTQSVWAKPVSFAIAVPEPETWGLAITGLLTVAFARRARNTRRAQG